jgi:putative ABC transport system permease protein
LWKEQFGGDPAIAGKTIPIDRQPHTVVGVAPAGFNFPIRGRKVQIWTTLARDAASATVQPVTEQRGNRMLGSIARLKPTVSLAAAQAQMDTIAASIAKQYNNNIASTYVRRELDRLVGDLRGPLSILSGAVALVLLIACANIANLLLVRTAERGREFALRMAIGAGKERVIRQLLTENLFLALLAGAVGALIATMALHLALPFLENSLPRMGEVRIDRGVLGFSVMLALLTTLLFSLPSALQLFRADLGGSLKEGARGATGASERLRGGLVVVQIAVGLILLSGAGLLTAGFSRLMRRDLGFRADHLLAFNIGLADTEYPSQKQVDFNARLQERLRALPGVVSTAAGMPLPLAGDEMSVSFNIQERPSAPSERPSSDMAIVTPSYFRTIGTPLLYGREFTERDDEKSPSVLIVNEAFARKFFPGQDAVGKRIEPGATSRVKGTPMREIIGVVGNARQSPLSMDPEPIYYFPYKQLPWSPPSIVLRTSIPPETLESAVRQQVASLDKQVPVYELRTLDDMLSAGVARPRFLMLLIGCFAAIALLLTAVGLYGVIAYSVLRRSQEIGIRIALGASRGMILGMILGRAMRLAMVGVPIGVAGVYAEENLLQSALYGLGPHNPLLLIAACLVVTLTALIAAYLPARRAASTDPMVALRSE